MLSWVIYTEYRTTLIPQHARGKGGIGSSSWVALSAAAATYKHKEDRDTNTYPALQAGLPLLAPKVPCPSSIASWETTTSATHHGDIYTTDHECMDTRK